MRPGAIALRVVSELCSYGVMTHVFPWREQQQRPTQGQERTLVLRSTHSWQLRVGLFLFCFFLGGASPGVDELIEASGLVEG
jgi:hypothetical protein